MSEAKGHSATPKLATAAQVYKTIGGFTSLKAFQEEWKQLEEDGHRDVQQFYRREVGKLVNS